MAAEFVGPPPPHRRGALQAKQNGHFAALGSAVDTSSMPGTSFRTLHATVNCRSSCWRERKLIIERVRAGRRHARLWGRTYPGPASTVFSATRPAPRQNGRGSRLNPARSSTTPTTASALLQKPWKNSPRKPHKINGRIPRSGRSERCGLKNSQSPEIGYTARNDAVS